MSCFVPGGASRLKNVQTYRWNRFLGLALLWLSPLAVHAQSPLLEQPIGDTPQLTPVQNEVPVEPESGGLIVPTPADPKSVFATQDDLFRQNLRIMELEQHLSQVQTETQKGLQEGRLRSTDIPLIEGLRKAPEHGKLVAKLG